MASIQTIEFNYNKAVQQADDLLEISQKLKEVAAGKLNDSIQAVDKNWDGENSIKFVKKGNKLKEKIEDSSKDIKKISGAIKSMAKAIYDAEMENIETAKTRSY